VKTACDLLWFNGKGFEESAIFPSNGIIVSDTESRAGRSAQMACGSSAGHLRHQRDFLCHNTHNTALGHD